MGVWFNWVMGILFALCAVAAVVMDEHIGIFVGIGLVLLVARLVSGKEPPHITGD